MYRFRNLFPLILLFCCFSTSCFAKARYEDLKVSSIQVLVRKSGNLPPYASNASQNQLNTKKGELFSQALFDQDLKLLAQTYEQVYPEIAVDSDGLLITINVTPRPKLRMIRWHGNERFTNKKLRQELASNARSTFDRKKFTQAMRDIRALYIKKGYFEADISWEIERDEDAGAVDIDIYINEGRSGKIKRIDFIGFEPHEERDIAENLVTKKYNLFTSWLFGTGVFREEMADQDEMRIVDYLQNQGYADAIVEIAAKEVDNQDRVIVEITAKKGQQYHVGTISLEGNTLFPTQELTSLYIIQEGSIYSPEQIRTTTQRITDHYGSCGYIDAYVRHMPHLREEGHIYDIELVVIEGTQYKVGMINVLGNTSTQTEVILNETLLTPGELFNVHRLKMTEERLRRIDYFEYVNVYAMRGSEDSSLGPEYRDVIIEVEEKSTGNFNIFAGFSTTESLFAGAGVTERNFNWKGIPYIFSDGYSALRGGGEYAHLTATIGQRHRNYLLSWLKPYFWGTEWTAGFDVERSNNRFTSKNYDIDATGFKIHASRQLHSFLRFGTHMRWRDADVSVQDTSDQQLLREARNAGRTVGVGITLDYNSTDNHYKPTTGFHSILEAEYIGLKSSHKMLSLGYLNCYYVPLHCKGTFKLRGDIRALLPDSHTSLEDIPISERLVLGGETSVRGYRPFSIGPKYAGDKRDPRGGMTQMLMSLEYNHCLASQADAFAFFDMGSVSEDDLSVENIRSSAGTGLRLYVIPNGPPLVLGIGFPINPESKHDVQRVFFSVGGRF